jgi:REP element-mobilizing transposase RayT
MPEKERPIPEWFKPLNRRDVIRDRRMLPHWHWEGGSYFITFRLADSISTEKKKYWNGLKREFLMQHPKPWDAETTRVYHRCISSKMERLLDAGYGSCLLGNPQVRQILVEALQYFEGERYFLDTFVIMPNHVHLIMAPTLAFGVSQILHSWKSFSAHQICQKFNIEPPLWLDESWDHLIRNEYYFRKYRQYIADNPHKAGLRSDKYFLWRKELQARGL